MSPRKKPEDDVPSPDQGAFFKVNVEPPAADGLTDPHDFSIQRGEVIIEVPEDGVYYPDTTSVVQEPSQPVPVEIFTAERAAADTQKRNRRLGNKGLHSAQHPETGRYEDGLRIGAVMPPLLPGSKPFIVKERNWEEAKAHARVLDARKAQQQAQNPQLISNADLSDQDVAEVVEGLVATHDVNAAIADNAIGGQDSQELSLLDSPRKLEILRDHKNAGFMPVTHDEKNTAVEILDMVEKDSPHGVHNYLMETHDHLVKEYMKQGKKFIEARSLAEAGVVSRVHEMADYRAAAKRDGSALVWLNAAIEDTPNPNLTLREALFDSGTEDSDTAFWSTIALIRFMDLVAARDYGEELPFSPMTEREDRSTELQAGKNKQLYDTYTAAFMLTAESDVIGGRYDAIRAHVDARMDSLKMRDIRTFLPKAIQNQRNRYVFWDKVIQGIKGPYQEAKMTI